MTTNDSLNQAQVFEDAADLLLMSERTRRTPNVANGEHCVVSAICTASSRRAKGLSDPCLNTLEGALRARGIQKSPHSSYCLAAQWSDATVDDFEVIDTLRHVAKDLRNNA